MRFASPTVAGSRRFASARLEEVRRLTASLTCRRWRLLAPMQELARCTAPLVVLLFTLHCTRPRVVGRPDQGMAGPETQGQAYTETGDASWYGGAGDGFAGRPTASGETFNPSEMTCAHKTLPLGTYLQVENLENGRRALLRVNDRGPFVRGRILDVSRQGARELGLLGPGVARVRLLTVDASGRPAPPETAESLQNPYTLQVAALADAGNVRRLSQELQQRFGAVSLQAIQGRDGQMMQRVRVGSYASYEEALKAAEQVAAMFKDRGVDPFITRQR